MNRRIAQLGFVLILLASLGGLLIPGLALPRLGLSAHTVGVMSGVLLIAVGAVWGQFTLSPTQDRALFLSWLYTAYINWLACLLGSMSGAGKMTPIAAAGSTGSTLAEILVGGLLVSLVPAIILAAGLAIYGLRSATR